MLRFLSYRSCPYTVSGRHEPNVILKDNDLKYKIRLPLPTAEHLLRQIQQDAEFLFSIGVCDYSLLVGVHNTEYDVLLSDGSVAASTAPSSSPNGSPVRRALLKKSSTANVLSSSPSGSGSGKHVESEKSGGAAAAREESADGVSITRKLEVYRVAGPDAYFMGIIDYQQKWNLKKKVCNIPDCSCDVKVYTVPWLLQMERFFKIHFRGADPEGLSAINPDVYKERFLRKIEDILDLDNSLGASRTVSTAPAPPPPPGSA